MEKFIVLEIQTSVDGQVATISTVHDTRDEAEQKYHLILSAAAVSTVWRHSANMIDSNGMPIKHETYMHNSAEPEAA